MPRSPTGRFTSEDPTQDDSNWYEFSGNNPVNFSDPTGTTQAGHPLTSLNLAAGGYSGGVVTKVKPISTGAAAIGNLIARPLGGTIGGLAGNLYGGGSLSGAKARVGQAVTSFASSPVGKNLYSAYYGPTKQTTPSTARPSSLVRYADVAPRSATTSGSLLTGSLNVGQLARSVEATERISAANNEAARLAALNQLSQASGANTVAIASSVTPGMSDLQDGYEVFTAREAYTGRPITGWNYALTVAGAALPVVGAAFFRKAFGAAEKVVENGIRYVDDVPHMSPAARAFEDAATGARSNVRTGQRQVPVLSRELADKSLADVKFDGIDGKVFIDRKLAVTNFEKTKDQALRQSDVLRQHGYTGRWEVPNVTQANRANRLLENLNIDNISVRVVR